jgi:hypothetical protein
VVWLRSACGGHIESEGDEITESGSPRRRYCCLPATFVPSGPSESTAIIVTNVGPPSLQQVVLLFQHCAHCLHKVSCKIFAHVGGGGLRLDGVFSLEVRSSPF